MWARDEDPRSPRLGVKTERAVTLWKWGVTEGCRVRGVKVWATSGVLAVLSPDHSEDDPDDSPEGNSVTSSSRHRKELDFESPKVPRREDMGPERKYVQ